MLCVERIKIRMQELGIRSWRQLARMMDISPSSLSQIKNLTTQPKMDSLHKMSKALKVPIAYLLGEDVSKEDIESTTNVEHKHPGVSHISQSTLALEGIMKELAFYYPDLAIGFRDVRESWDSFSELDKCAIAEALMEVFQPNPNRSSRLRDSGYKGKV